MVGNTPEITTMESQLEQELSICFCCSKTFGDPSGMRAHCVYFHHLSDADFDTLVDDYWAGRMKGELSKDDYASLEQKVEEISPPTSEANSYVTVDLSKESRGWPCFVYGCQIERNVRWRLFDHLTGPDHGLNKVSVLNYIQTHIDASGPGSAFNILQILAGDPLLKEAPSPLNCRPLDPAKYSKGKDVPLCVEDEGGLVWSCFVHPTCTVPPGSRDCTSEDSLYQHMMIEHNIPIHKSKPHVARFWERELQDPRLAMIPRLDAITCEPVHTGLDSTTSTERPPDAYPMTTTMRAAAEVLKAGLPVFGPSSTSAMKHLKDRQKRSRGSDADYEDSNSSME